MEKKAIGLFSGGLDSCVAVKLVLEQDFNVTCLSFDLWRYPGEKEAVHPLETRARSLGAQFRLIDLSDDYPHILLNPRWKYGTAVNPCIDCKLLMLKKAAEVMKSENALFVFTGEVLGQRPMTQNKTIMNLLERQSGLTGRLLRPLCAKLLPPTVAEWEGILDRAGLLDIQGRSRRRQITIAEKYNITGYSSPAGGCILTEKEYAGRLQDFMTFSKKPLNAEALELLRTGRHFRISPNAKIIVGKNEKENRRLEIFRQGRIVLLTHGFEGPLVLFEGEPSAGDLEIAARIAARYGQGRQRPRVRVRLITPDMEKIVEVNPIIDRELAKYRIRFNRGLLDKMLAERNTGKHNTGKSEYNH